MKPRSTTTAQRAPAALSPLKKGNTLVSKKKGATSEKPCAFSLTPYHEQILAANKLESSSESEYDSYASDRDPSNDSYWFTSSDEDDDEAEIDEEEMKYRANRLTMYAKQTHYDVIKEVAKFNFEYHLTKREMC